MMPPDEVFEFSKEHVLSNSFPVPQSFSNGIGVYFLIKDNEIVYIGKSVDLRKRLGTHKRRIDFNRVFIIPHTGKDWLIDIEITYIKKFQPILNQCVNPNMRKLKVPSEKSKRGFTFKFFSRFD